MTTESKSLPGGMVVFFEGIDGAGKTTQLELVAATLRDEGWPVETTRSHGGTDIGEQLREVSLSGTERPVDTDFFISMATQSALMQETERYRQDGCITLIDRSPLSIVAYQMYGDGFEHQLGWQLVERNFKKFAPELSILYAATVKTARQRIMLRSDNDKSDYFESKPDGYFEDVSLGYSEAAKRFGVTVIDAEQSIQAVHEQTMSAIDSAIDLKQHARTA